MKAILKISFTLLFLGFYSLTLADIHLTRDREKSGNTSITIGNCQTEKGSYRPGDQVKFSFTVVNGTSSSINVQSITVNIVDLNIKDSVIHHITLATHVLLGSKKSYQINNTGIWTLPNYISADPYGIFIEYTLADGTKSNTYQTFFRVIKGAILTTFNIKRYNYNGLSIFDLDGGMSAEYAIEKAGESLCSGMSDSWKVNARGSGPNQVFSTPQFLENSVKATVSFYDQNFGIHTSYNTVIISTGIPSVPYIARAMKAPVLPLHFLVSANSVKEIQTILNYSNRKGYLSYSTLGYDSSVPNQSVAWIKLLDIPKEYVDFLKRHRVQHVIILAATSPVGGEATAKKVIASSNQQMKYAPGSIFLLYPQGGVANDIAELKARVKDFDQVNQQTNFTRVADWESGIIPEQLKNFSTTIKHSTAIKDMRFITGKDDEDLYKLATYVTLAFIHKNVNSFAFHGQTPVKGVVLNPYLISNPVFESRFGYIPLVYWQGNPTKSVIKELTTTVQSAISVYFPQLQLNDLNIWINSSLNFGDNKRALALKQSLLASGLAHIKTNNYSIDEVWDPADGMTAPCELKTLQLLNTVSAKDFKKWNDGLVSLTPSDLTEVSRKFTSILITQLK